MENNTSFTLTAYESHLLLKELEYLLSIVNRNQQGLKLVYEKIAGQLHDIPIKVGN